VRRISLLVFAAALGLAGCTASGAPSRPSGEPNEQARAYASIVCGKAAAWKADVVQGLNRIRIQIKHSRSPQDAKAVALHAANGWARSTAKVFRDIQAQVPPPATPGADTYHDRLLGALKAFGKTVAAFRSHVAAFGSTSSTLTRISDAISTVKHGLSGLGQSFRAIADTPMDRALAEDAACSYLKKL
jgi:hypothetical protein